ncbi:MAG: amino acid ABC transporter substrate-binding protein [Clostridiales bacterium]|nr:amino acid ABC transporter substrate-binding protein [Clostridiales bacterium]
MNKKIITFLMAIILVLTTIGCSTSGSKAEDTITVEKGKFTVGFDDGFPPMGFIGDDGEYTGFDLELAAEVAKRLDLELVLQPISWDAKDAELSTKTIDCIWNGFTINGREDDYTWTKPYMKNNQVFVVRADSDINTLDDLEGVTVMVQTDSSAEAALKDKQDLVDTFGDYLTADNYTNALTDLEAGSVDAVAMDDVVANYQMEQRPGVFAILDDIISMEDYGVGFLLGNDELKDIVEKTLLDMAEDGFLAETSEKWFGKDVTIIDK